MLAALEQRDQRPRQLDDGMLVEAGDGIILLVRQLVGGEAADHGAGIVDQHVDGLEARLHGIDEGLHAGGLEEIRIGDRGAALGNGSLKKVRQAVRRGAAAMQQHGGTAIEEAARNLEADAATGTRDHDAGTFKQCGTEHETSS